MPAHNMFTYHLQLQLNFTFSKHCGGDKILFSNELIFHPNCEFSELHNMWLHLKLPLLDNI